MKGIKITTEEAKQEFLFYGVKMIGEFKGTNYKTLCICKCGVEYYSILANFRRGQKSYCVNCHKLNTLLRTVLSLEKVIKDVEKNGFKYIGNYINVDTPMDIICSCGRKRKMTLSNIRKRRKCGCEPRRGEKHPMWKPDRKQLMEDRKFKKACYTMVARSMNRKTNKNHTEELLGYTSEQLQNHIKNHPDYPKILKSNERLAIDHIIPLQAFKDYDMLNEDYVWLINHLDNLRPTIMSWNSSKNSKYNVEDFNNYLISHRVVVPNIKHN